MGEGDMGYPTVKVEPVEKTVFGDLNPLLIPSVISEVLPYLSFQDVKRAKLVCLLWADEGTKILARNGRFGLTGEQDIRDFLKHLRNPRSPSKVGSVKTFNIKLSSAVQIFANNSVGLLQSKEYQRLMKEIGKKLKSVILDVEVWRWERKPLWQFLYSDAPNLESLGLSLQTNKETSLDRFEFNGFPKVGNPSDTKLFPNIKHLTFLYQNKLSVPHANYLAAELFSRMPNLKKFTCEDGSNNKHFREEIIWQFFRIKDFHKFNRNFSEFDFNLDLNEEEVTKFHELLKYPLESLKLSLRPGLRFPALYSFISSLGSTLTTLQLDFIFIPLHAEKFPCGRDLVNLKYLSFKNYNGPLNFIHHTEKLEKLILTNVNLSVAFREEDQHFHFDTPHGLKSLEVFGAHSNAGRFTFTHIFQKMTTLFPKLKKFRMDYLTDANIKIIAAGFEDLEELIMENSVCTDEGVTGIPSSNFRMLPSTASTGANNPVDESRLPSIAMLKRLRTLHLNSPMISDRSLKFGIGLCKELRYLSLSSPMITGDELKNLAQKLHLHSMKLISCYRVTETETVEIKKILPHGATVCWEIV